MVWYKPRTWFKNKPSQPTQPTQTTANFTWWALPITWGVQTWSNLSWWVLSWTNLTWGTLWDLTWWVSSWNNLNFTWQNLSWTNLTWWANTWNVFTWKNTWKEIWDDSNPLTFSFLTDVINQIKATSRARTSEKLANIVDTNRNNAHTISWFSLDPFDIDTGSLAWWSPVSSTVVASKDEEEEEKNYMENLQDASDSIVWDLEKKWKEEDTWFFWRFWDAFTSFDDVVKNSLERQFPNAIWQSNINSAADKKFWWDLTITFDNAVEGTNYEKLSYQYLWWQWDYLRYDINKTIPEAMEKLQMWTMSKSDFDTLIDTLYNKYKDWFELWNPWYPVSIVDYSATTWEDSNPFTKELFIKMIDKQREKARFKEEEKEKRWLVKESETQSAVLNEIIKYWNSVVWPKLENSSIRTVEWREKYMTSFEWALIDFWWRAYGRLYPMLKVKQDIEKELWVDDLFELWWEWIPDEYKSEYYEIEKEWNDFNTFIKNYVNYWALAIDTADPDSGQMERVPEYVIDWDKSYTFREALFNWIDLRYWRDTFWFWWDSMSPLDVLQKESIELEYDRTQKKWWTWDYLWTVVQYWWTVRIWATISELWQQSIWRAGSFIWNLANPEKTEVPFEFKDMDSSITASMTTTKGNLWRLMQSYDIKIWEYAPELLANTLEAVLADKWATKVSEISQVRLLSLLNKSKYFTNTVKWRQMALWLASTIWWLERLWFDQALIDAPLAIWDWEWWSPTSQMLSLWWTVFWEWIWILLENRALINSFMRNFSKNTDQVDALVDPIRLIVENPKMLDDVAASMWRTSVDDAWNVVWDANKLLVKDLTEYSKFLKELSNTVEDVTRWILTNWWTIDVSNKTIKQWAYKVLKQVFNQDSAMSKIVTDLITDQRSNIADIVKYIWWINWTVKIWPFISTIKVSNWWNLVENVVKKYDEKMDLVVDWWLVAWINRWLTRLEVDELVKQWFIKASDISKQWDDVLTLEKYFVPYVDDAWEVRYFPTKKWLEMLWVDTLNVSNPLAVAAMSEDTRNIVEQLKKLPQNKKAVTDLELEKIWETDAITRLAENIANLKHLDICK